MVVEVGGGGEALPAHGALVWLLPAVDPPVSVEGAGRGESFPANVAHVRLLSYKRRREKERKDFVVYASPIFCVVVVFTRMWW